MLNIFVRVWFFLMILLDFLNKIYIYEFFLDFVIYLFSYDAFIHVRGNIFVILKKKNHFFFFFPKV